MFLHAFHALVLIWFAELTKVQMRNIQLWRLSTKPLTALKVIGFAKSSKMKTKEKGTKCLALHSNWIDLDSWMQQFAKVYHSCRYHKANSFVVRIVHRTPVAAPSAGRTKQPTHDITMGFSESLSPVCLKSITNRTPNRARNAAKMLHWSCIFILNSVRSSLYSESFVSSNIFILSEDCTTYPSFVLFAYSQRLNICVGTSKSNIVSCAVKPLIVPHSF